jgi:AcrR family transcriptional regulator
MARIKKLPVVEYPNQRFTKGLVVSSAAKNIHLVETKRQRIVRGASKSFFARGFHATTIRMIAEASQMSMGQLYHYVSSKDDVLYLVHESVYKGLYGYLRDSGVEEITDPLQRLALALRYTLAFIWKNKKLIQFAYSESKHLRKKYLRFVLEMYMENVVRFWRELLDDLNRKKPIKLDLDFAASFIAHQTSFLALNGWTVEHRSVNKNIDLLIDLILRSMGFSLSALKSRQNKKSKREGKEKEES